MKNNLYFKWLCDKVVAEPNQYNKLLSHLFSKPYNPRCELDKDRATDGLYLRKEYFGEISDEPCSVLEMMVALAVRCEKSIMSNDDKGDRTSQWFLEMLVSYGLGQMTDDNFDSMYVDSCLEINNPFSVNSPVDMHRMPIWDQMQLYLIEVAVDEGILKKEDLKWVTT